MKNFFKSIFIISLLSFFFSCNDDPAAEVEQLDCAQYWSRLSLSSFCSMDLQIHFEREGIVDNCNADNTSDSIVFPSEELIYIFVFNAFSEEGAMEEYEELRSQDESSDSFVKVSNIGDAAHADLAWDMLGNIDYAIFEVVKGQYGAHIEINFSQSGGNCLDENTMYDFARAIVNAL